MRGWRSISFRKEETDEGEDHWTLLTPRKSLFDVPTSLVPLVTDSNERSVEFEYQGLWAVSTEVPGPNGVMLKHRSLVGSGEEARVRIVVPANSSFLVINGTAGPEHGAISVQWKNGVSPPYVLERQIPATTLDSSWYAASNSSRPFISTCELLYYACLNPASRYQFLPGPDDDGIRGKVALHSITFYSGLSS